MRVTFNRDALPMKRFKIAVPPCMFCPMKSITRCNITTCDLPLCAKHAVRRAGGKLCKKHAGAILIQYEGTATEKFADRGGEGRAHEH